MVNKSENWHCIFVESLIGTEKRDFVLFYCINFFLENFYFVIKTMFYNVCKTQLYNSKITTPTAESSILELFLKVGAPQT